MDAWPELHLKFFWGDRPPVLPKSPMSTKKSFVQVSGWSCIPFTSRLHGRDASLRVLATELCQLRHLICSQDVNCILFSLKIDLNLVLWTRPTCMPIFVH